MTFSEMIPVDSTSEYLKVTSNLPISANGCNATTEQIDFIKSQLKTAYGDCKIAISPKGCVFASQDAEVYYIGRVDAKFNVIFR